MNSAMHHSHLIPPWVERSYPVSKPGSIILKLPLGEAPEEIPSVPDVRIGACQAASHTRLEPVDHVLTHFSDQVQVARVFTAAANVGLIGERHRGFNDLEQILGLSRTFRVEVNQTCFTGELSDALRQMAVVEEAHPNYLSTLPFMWQPSPSTNVAAIPLAESGHLNPLPIADDALRQSDGWAERHRIHALEAMAYEPGDPSIVIAVVDTGVAQGHVELRGRLRDGGIDTVELGSTHLAHGIELVGDLRGIDTDPEDIVGHGTSCAAIIAALGQRMPPGLAGECRVLPIRVLGAARFSGKSTLTGIGAMADIDLGVKTAIDLGAKVINMSFGTPEAVLDSHAPIPHSDVVRYGLAQNCIMVAASGNSGRNERYAPASLDNVIAVGAVDQNNKPASFSTGGEHVDISVSGVRVLSTGLHGYQYVTGTSFAAPFVAATAGLLVSRANRRAYPLNSAAVRRILRESADPWSDGNIKGHGVGTLNAYAALQRLDKEIDQSYATTFDVR